MEIEKIHELLPERFNGQYSNGVDISTARRVAGAKMNVFATQLTVDPNYYGLVLLHVNGNVYGGFYFLDGMCYAAIQYDNSEEIFQFQFKVTDNIIAAMEECIKKVLFGNITSDYKPTV